MSSGRNARSWLGQRSSLSLGRRRARASSPAAITLSLTAEIFCEGLKAGLLTFGGAFTVIPFLQETARRGQAG